MKFTVKSTAALELPTGRSDHVFWEDSLPGFGLRLREGGSRNWVFQYALGKKQRRMSLGSATAMPLVKAREIATELYAKVKLGKDPAGEKEQAKAAASETFGHVAEKYLAIRKQEMRPGAYLEIDRHLTKHAKPFHRFQLTAIDQRAVAARILEIRAESGAVTANRVRSSLSALYAWSMRQGIATQNPVANTGKFEERSRERTLNDTELCAIWKASGDDIYGSIVKLLALTGLRADEVASLKWSEISLDNEVISLPGERVKNKRAHDIPIVPAVRAILEAQPRRVNADGSLRDFVFGTGQGGFSGWSKAKKQLDERIAAGATVAPWRLHDLRRSLATNLQRLGVRLEVTEAILNHVGGSRGGIVGVYQRHDWANEKRAALAAWANRLAEIVEGKSESNVTMLRRA
jgi:integrase